eukprot:3356900-Amphidinium_carterae.1
MDKALERRRTESNLRQGIKHFRDGQPRSPSPMAPFKSPTQRTRDRSQSGQRRSPGGRRDGRGTGYPMKAKTNEQRRRSPSPMDR